MIIKRCTVLDFSSDVYFFKKISNYFIWLENVLRKTCDFQWLEV